MKLCLKMKRLGILGPLLTFTLLTLYNPVYANSRKDPLPKNFKIYVNKQGEVLTHPAEEFEKRTLPTFNLFLENPGCYVLCETKISNWGVYPVSSDIFVVGQIRVKGEYEGRVCVPYDYNAPDLENSDNFKELCSKIYKCVGNSCWAEGDSGAWFGIP